MRKRILRVVIAAAARVADAVIVAVALAVGAAVRDVVGHGWTSVLFWM